MRRGPLAYAACFVVACAAIQYSPRLFGLLISSGQLFEKIDPANWKADLSKLPTGEYFVSAGRPRGRCEIRLDGVRIESNFLPESPYRSRITLSSPFDKAEGAKADSNLPGARRFAVGANGQPGDRQPNWRTAPTVGTRTDTNHARPIASLFLLLYLATSAIVPRFQGIRRHLSAGDNTFEQRGMIYLPVFALIYTLSLSHVLYLFIPSSIAATTHILVRSGYAMCFTAFFTRKKGTTRNRLLAAHGLQIVGVLVLALLWPEQLQRYYFFSFAIFVAGSGYAAASLFRAKRTHSNLASLERPHAGLSYNRLISKPRSTFFGRVSAGRSSWYFALP